MTSFPQRRRLFLNCHLLQASMDHLLLPLPLYLLQHLGADLSKQLFILSGVDDWNKSSPAPPSKRLELFLSFDLRRQTFEVFFFPSSCSFYFLTCRHPRSFKVISGWRWMAAFSTDAPIHFPTSDRRVGWVKTRSSNVVSYLFCLHVLPFHLLKAQSHWVSFDSSHIESFTLQDPSLPVLQGDTARRAF